MTFFTEKPYYVILDGRYGPQIRRCLTCVGIHQAGWITQYHPSYKKFSNAFEAERCMFGHYCNIASPPVSFLERQSIRPYYYPVME